MHDFLDLQGASGALYRFRRWPEGAAHLPIAGNYVVIQETASGFKVLAVGASMNLSLERQAPAGRGRRKPTHYYTRLNVSRAARTFEHEDLVAHYKPAEVAAENA
jgi:hypothetical protein